jgi:hypothetical protein
VIVEAENRGQPEKPPQPTGSRKAEGPDTKTCTRLVQHLLDSGEVQLTRLQYNQELVTNTREVRVFGGGGMGALGDGGDFGGGGAVTIGLCGAAPAGQWGGAADTPAVQPGAGDQHKRGAWGRARPGGGG